MGDGSSGLSQFVGRRYVSLETFRANGSAVRTPVWFVLKDDNNLLYIRTHADSGKARRMMSNSRVRMVPCTITGAPRGVWVSGEARKASPEESEIAERSFGRRYNVQKWLLDLVARLMGKRYVVFSIRIDSSQTGY